MHDLCVDYIESIPLYRLKMQKMCKLVEATPYKWQLKMIPIAVADKETLDYLMATTVKQHMDRCCEVMSLITKDKI